MFSLNEFLVIRKNREEPVLLNKFNVEKFLPSMPRFILEVANLEVKTLCE